MLKNGSLLTRIQRLEAIEAIKGVIAAYGRGADGGNDVNMMMPLFTQNVVWDGGKRFGRYEGNAAVRDFLLGSRTFMGWTLHYMISPVVEVSQDTQTATASWYLWELAEMSNPDSRQPEAHWIGADYETQLQKEGDRWKFSLLRFNVRLLSRYSEGWSRTPAR